MPTGMPAHSPCHAAHPARRESEQPARSPARLLVDFLDVLEEQRGRATQGRAVDGEIQPNRRSARGSRCSTDTAHQSPSRGREPWKCLISCAVIMRVRGVASCLLSVHPMAALCYHTYMTTVMMYLTICSHGTNGRATAAAAPEDTPPSRMHCIA